MVTVYFQNNWNWTDINLYLWNSTTNNNWPGAKMELVGTSDGKELYALEFDANVYTSFIINGINTGWDPANNRDKTPDLAVADCIAYFATDIFYMEWKDGNALGHFAMSADATLHIHEYNSYDSNETHHWQACSCKLAAADAVQAEHVWDEGEVTTPPTCTVAGVKTYTCLCGATKTEEVEALGHTPGAEATCTEAQTCTVCSAELAAAKGHTPGAEATCTEAQKCSVCQAE